MTLVKFNADKRNGLDVFDAIFNDTFFNERMVARVPAVNISETEDRYQVELAAPGLKKEDFKITLEDHVLNISVEQQSENKNYSKREYNYRSFVRSFTLPDSANAENIEAAYTDGVLTIDIAKREEAKQVRRQIDIK